MIEQNQISDLKDHYIICGAGRTGRYIANQFSKNQLSFIVIEQDDMAIEHLKNKVGPQTLYIKGDASEDEILKIAGIKQAAGLLTSLRNDKDNAFVVLTARSLNPNLRIASRVNDEEENADKLRKAGADVIVSPTTVGGMRIASEMIRPEVVTFLDYMLYDTEASERLRFAEIRVDELRIPGLGPYTPLYIADIGKNTELLVVAIKYEGKYIYKPKGDTRLRRGIRGQGSDVLVVIGTQEQLNKVQAPLKG